MLEISEQRKLRKTNNKQANKRSKDRLDTGLYAVVKIGLKLAVLGFERLITLCLPSEGEHYRPVLLHSVYAVL